MEKFEVGDVVIYKGHRHYPEYVNALGVVVEVRDGMDNPWVRWISCAWHAGDGSAQPHSYQCLQKVGHIDELPEG